MKYAVNFFRNIDNPWNIPGDWPCDARLLNDSDPIPTDYTEMSISAYNTYIIAHQSEYDAWWDSETTKKLLLKEKLRDDVDAKTDCLIACGYEYQNIQFKMDLEHQMSYKSVYDFRQFLTFPYTIKGVGENYLTFQNEAEMQTFTLYGLGWMQAVLQGGWEIKTSFETMTYQQLLDWTDPRDEM